MQIRLIDPVKLALQEIKDGSSRDSVAQTLAFVIYQEEDADWKPINAAILKRWKPSGREYILKKAWKLVEERKAR